MLAAHEKNRFSWVKIIMAIIEIPCETHWYRYRKVLRWFYYFALGVFLQITSDVSWSGKKKQKKNIRFSHSPLLEVNRTGSLLIAKSNSCNPSRDSQERAADQRLPGTGKIHEDTLFQAFRSSLWGSANSFYPETSLLPFQTYSPNLFLLLFLASSPSSPPSPPKRSLYPTSSLSLLTAWTLGMRS